MQRYSRRDADNYERYVHAVMRQCRFIRPLLLRTPPDPVALRARDVGELLFLGRRFHDMGQREMGEAIRFWTMSIGDFLDQYFETPVDQGASGRQRHHRHRRSGVYSPGTAYVLLHHYMGDVDGAIGAWGFARGGMGAVSRAMGAALEAAGGEIRAGSGVERFLIRNNLVTGVALDNGDEFHAPIVVSNMDVKRTFLRHMNPSCCPRSSCKGVRRFKIRGSSGKLNIALDAMPDFPAAPKGAPFLKGDLHCSDSLESLERAYDDWKAGPLVRGPLFRPADPEPDRSDHGAARQAHGDRVRPVRPLRAQRRPHLERPDARGFRRHRPGQDRPRQPRISAS